jgi:hypothetical protein
MFLLYMGFSLIPLRGGGFCQLNLETRDPKAFTTPFLQQYPALDNVLYSEYR